MAHLTERGRAEVGEPTAPGTDMRERSTRVGAAELRARRVASAALGVALLVYTAADLAAIQDHPVMLSHWWSIASLLGRLASGIALLATPWFAGATALRVLAFSVGAFGTVMVSISLAATGTEFEWALRAQSLYVWAMPLAVRPRWAWAWILVFECLAAADRAMRATDPFQFLESTLVALTLTVLLVSILIVFLRMARARDAQEQSALRAIREDAYQAARTAELRRIERIVHDEVLSTLRAASLGLATAQAQPALLAAAALDRLAVLDQVPDDAEAPVQAAALLNRLHALVTAIAPETEVRVAGAGAPAIPADAAGAIVEACGEALRNSVVHAPVGRPVSRVVRVRLEPNAIAVTVDDDGDGFDTQSLPPHRLGVARSILERMRAVPGGDASVRSQARSGTSVTVSWRG